MSTPYPSSLFSWFFRLFPWVLVAVGGLFQSVVAQAQYYEGGRPNFHAGPINLNLTSSFTAEYNTNILLLPSGEALRDLILTPGIDFLGSWKLSKYNTIRLGLGLGYQCYVQHPELSSINNFLNMSPDCRLSVNLKMGAFSVTPYESLSFSTDSTNVPGVTAQGGGASLLNIFGRFSNEAGVNVLWHLNRKLEPYLRIYRSDTIPFKSAKYFDAYKSYTYVANPGFTYALASNLNFGVDASLSMNRYKTGFNNNSNGFALGPTASWDITPRANLSSDINYSIYQFKNTGKNGDASQPRSLQWNFSFLHLLKSNFEYNIFTTRSLSYGYVSNAVQTTDIGLSIQWRFVKRANFRMAAVHEKGQDSGGYDPETYKSITAGFGIDFLLDPRTSLSFDFEHSKKTSNLAIGDYSQDRFIFGAAYDF